MSTPQQPYGPPPTPPFADTPPVLPVNSGVPETSNPTMQYPPTAPPAKPGNGLGLAALIVGIFAFIGAFIPFINYVSGVLAVVGIVLGIVAITRKNKPKKAGTAGLIVSVIALILSTVLAITYTAGFVAAVDDALPQTSVENAEEEPEAAPVEKVEPEATADIGTRENPAPIGTTVEVTSLGDTQYEVTLGAPTLNATDLVAAANEFNDAAPEGFQYAIVPVAVTYVGAETGTPWIDLQISFVSAAGTTHIEGDTLAVGPSPTFMEINELYPDASGTGNIVIAIPTADAEKGTWTVAPLFSGDTFFFAAQ